MKGRILVTGGTGFVGINICQKLLEMGKDVVIFDQNRLKKDDEEELKKGKGNLTICTGDVLDKMVLKQVMEENDITDVIHAAAITPGVKMEAECGKKIIEVNCLGTIHVLEAFIEKKITGKFLLLGSISAYGKTALQNEPLIEGESMANPISLYEISKFTAEKIFLRYKNLYQISGCVVRIGDVFGPWEHYSGVRTHMSLPYQATNLAIKGKKAFFSRNYCGEWIYGPELAEVVNQLLEIEIFHYDVYPLSSKKRWTMEEWCQLLKKCYPEFTYCIATEEAAINLKINQKTDNAPMISDYLVKEIGFCSRFGLQEAFADYMVWIAKHPNYFG